jgi:CDP-diacylglycerol--glycerol-3-phosphate 3-phosphatidyltransferase
MNTIWWGMNLPNQLTIARIVLTFVFMFFLFAPSLSARILAFLVFSLAALTDLYDGWIARRRNLVTDFGRLMDPIADKILVISAFLAFVELKIIPAWMVIIIIAREFLITGLRLLAANKNIIIAASESGKHKTVSQMVSIFVILAFLVFKEIAVTYFNFWNTSLENNLYSAIYYLMVVTVILTIISGLAILLNNKSIFWKNVPSN